MSESKGTVDPAPEMTVGDRNEDCANAGTFTPQENETDADLENDMLHYLARSKAIFKSQQKEDPELSIEEKLTIAHNVLKKSHCLFLSKFGHHLKQEHLKYFDKSKEEDYEVAYRINRLQRYFNNSKRHMDIKNRRYEALKTLVEKGEYFSECEMMRRNPLLYEQLVGQYMTEKQKKARDNIDTKNITFVNLLMESMERDSLRKRQKLQEEEEHNAMEESDSEEEGTEACVSQRSAPKRERLYQWGEEIDLENQMEEQSSAVKVNKTSDAISKKEKQLLKQEFVSNMYQSFLDGKDADFDYSTVDDNEAYDNIDLRTQDEEEKYFDSESPEIVGPAEDVNKNESEGENQNESEDELDAYMKSLKVK